MAKSEGRRASTKEQLAEALGIEQPAVSKIENETVNVTLDNLRAIAKFLGVYIGELVEKLPMSDEARLIGETYDQLPEGEKRLVHAMMSDARKRQAGASREE